MSGQRINIYLFGEALRILLTFPSGERSKAIAAAIIATYGEGQEAAKARIVALLTQASE